MKRLLSALVASIALLGLTPHSPVFTDADASQPLVVRAGEDFFIALPANATTGYSWSANIDDRKIAAYEGNVYQNSTPVRPGSGGQQLFIFHANRSGSTTIAFAYARPFEPNGAPSKSLIFSLSVQ